jgi:hypothetical protein
MSIPQALIQTVLIQVVPLLLPGTDGDIAAARESAIDTIFAYNPQTADEFILAAKIVTFNLKSFETIRIAASPDLAIARMLRLESSAASLSREAAKAERQLTQRQKARQAANPAPEPVPVPEPTPQPAAAKVRTARPIRSFADIEDEFEARVAATIKEAEAHLAALDAGAPDPSPFAAAA